MATEYETYKENIKKLFDPEATFLEFGRIKTWANINVSDPQNYFDPNFPHYFILTENKDKLIHIQNDVIKTTFYTNYTYFKPMYSLFKDPIKSLKYCRVKIETKPEQTIKDNYQKWHYHMVVYVKPGIIQTMYNDAEVPDILKALIKKQSYKEVNFIPQEVQPINSNSIDLEGGNRSFFPHQAANIEWCVLKELSTEIEIPKLMENYRLYQPPCLDEPLIYDKSLSQLQLIKPEECPMEKLSIRGGMLCDQVGLGKTYTMIGLCLANPVPLTVVLCPGHLCNHWYQEFTKYTNIPVLKMCGIAQFKKYHKDTSKYKVLICSLTVLTNQKIQEHEKPSLHMMPIDRLIFDEAHTLITTHSLRKKERLIAEKVYEIYNNARNKWLCSATFDFSKFNLMKFLVIFTGKRHLYPSVLSYSLKHLLDQIVRLNTKESVQAHINIPHPEISNVFLKQSRNEKLIYQSALGDPLMRIQLCSHVLVSEVHAKILGQDPIGLEEATQKFLQHFRRRLEYYTQRLESLEEAEVGSFGTTTEDELKELKDNSTRIIKESQARLNIFGLMEQTVNQDDCPICLNSLKDQTPVVAGCGHMYCSECINTMFQRSPQINCALCRRKYKKSDFCPIKMGEPRPITPEEKWGTKMFAIVEYLRSTLQDPEARIIVFSRFQRMLKLIQVVFEEFGLPIIRVKGSSFHAAAQIRKFKLDSSYRIILLCSEKMSCGINLTEASHVLLLDTFTAESACLSKAIEEQAIGRAVRLGQNKQVQVKRFIMEDTIEHDRFKLC